MKTTYDSKGKILYRVHSGGSVTDKNGRLLGRVKNGRTENRNGRIVARCEAPGLLLNS